MNIVKESLENQTALLKVTVEAADYAEAVEKTLKNYKRKANVPGFRPGMVPMSLVNKMYKKGVTAEESYRTAGKALSEYLHENKIEILGEPLPAESQPTLDFDNGTTFEFHFEIGLAPEIKLDLSKLTLNKYKVKVSDEMRENFTKNYLRRFGKLVDVDVVKDEEALSVNFDNDELNIEDAYIGLTGMTEEERKPFIGKKVGDKMEININELYKNPQQRATALSVKQEELDALDPKFTMTIARIRSFETPELNEDLYKEAFPDGSVTDKKQFDAMAEAEIEKGISRDTEYRFVNDSRKAIVAAAALALPEKFLRNWLIAINEGKFTAEQIDKDFEAFLDMMKWDILKRHFVKEGNIEVKEDDVRAEAKNMAASQFAMYGMNNVDDETLTNYANSIMGNAQESNRIYEHVYEIRTIDYVSTKAKIKETSISAEDYSKLS